MGLERWSSFLGGQPTAQLSPAELARCGEYSIERLVRDSNDVVSATEDHEPCNGGPPDGP